mmetsp:Transcript_20811/g.25240  ORF Transcript_20811/g.25240 Transcript_20811/m.25240 type:complete len:155 (+) Transcript_20811:108-572(+)
MQLPEPYPLKSKGLALIVRIACGKDHAAAITRGGLLYVWGKGYSGQLGLNDRNDRNVPTLLAFKYPHADRDVVSRVACGDEHTVVITKSGRACSFGKGSHGRLGLGDNKDRLAPRWISLTETLNTSTGAYKVELRAFDVAAGSTSTTILCRRRC